MRVDVIKVENPDGKYQIIIGQANFTIFACDDIFKSLLTAVPGIRCAVAMNEAAPKLTRVTGNDEKLKEIASKNALKIGASHIFVVVVENAFPINVLNAIKSHPTVCNIYAASANPMEVIVAETELGRAILGIVDGQAVNTIENDEQRKERRRVVEELGYKIE